MKDFCTQQYAVVYVSQGEGRYVAQEGRFTLRPGCVFQRYPNRPHTVVFDVPYTTHFMAVPRAVYEMLAILHTPTLHSPVFQIGVRPSVIERLESIRVELRDQRPELLMATLTRMQAFIFDLHRMAVAPDESSFQQTASELLSLRLDQSVPIPELVADLPMSYNTFRQRFARQMGISPGEFRIHRRIERAQELVANPGIELKEIPAMLGYSDYYSFSAQFKKHVGMPPRQFRQRNA